MMLLMMLLTATTAWAEGVDYIDENGVAKNTATDDIVGNDNPTVLTSGGATSLSGWYYVSGTVNITGMVTLSGDVHIILCDKATLNIGTAGERISSNCIYGDDKTLTIYGQSGQTGTLKAYNSASSSSAVYARNYTQHGGNVIIDGTNAKPLCLSGGNLTLSRGTLSVTTAATCSAIYLDIGKSVNISGGTLTATSEHSHAIESAVNMSGGTLTANAPGSYYNYAIFGDVTFTGGKLTANGGSSSGISGNVSLSWSSLNDSFTCNSFHTTVTIADGKTFYDETGASYTSSTTDLNTAIEGKTLRPYSPADFSVSGDEYTIHNATGWDVFCEALQDNTTYNRFSGKTVKLGGNIGSAESPVTRMAGTSQHDFCGTFDGKGYTLTVNLSSDSDHDYTAPFSYVANAKANPGDTSDSPAAIRNLNVAGTVNATKDYDYASGIVGAFWGTLTIENCTSSVTINTGNKDAAGFIGRAAGNVTMRNCLSSVTINSSTGGDGTHGGLIGVSVSGKTFTIEGCAFTGSLLSTGEDATIKCGGFVGWNGGTLTIRNSLFAPASVTVGASNSATFSRYEVGCVPNIDNCYYTSDFNDGEHFTAQGKQRRSIEPGDNVTISHAGVATTYDVSGITAYKASDAHGDSDPFIAGILYDEVLYAGSDNQVSLTLSNNAPVPPTGYLYSYTASAGTLGGNDNPYTLTMPDEDVTINLGDLRSDGQNHPVTYMKADGTTATQEAIALDETMTSLYGQWYYVGKDIDYTRNIHLEATNIIFGDGTTMNIGTSERPLSDNSIDVHTSFTTYGQSLDVATAGHLNIYSTQVGIYSNGAYNQNGGNVTINITGTGTFQNGIMGNSAKISGGTLNITTDNGDGIDAGSITIEGGQVDVHAGGYGKYGLGRNSGYTNITLGWTNADDHINANSYKADHVRIAEGKALSYTSGGTRTVLGPGELTDDQITAIAGKNLVPVIPVSYTAADGTTQQCYDYTELTSGGAQTLVGGWYYVSGTVDITGTLTLGGDVTLILADGATLNIGTEDAPISSGRCIYGDYDGWSGKYSLTLYGQTAQSGALNAYNSTTYAVYLKNYTQHGGNVTIETTANREALMLGSGDLTLTRGSLTATGNDAISLDEGHTATVSGGTLNATGAANAIWGGTLALSGSATATINGGINGDVVIANGQAFEGAEGHYFSGTLTDSEKAAISGQTLTRLTSLPIAEEQYVWHAIASPMMDNANGTIVAFSYVDGFRFINTRIDLIDLYRYNEATATWENILDHFNIFGSGDFRTLDPGRGYIVRHSSPTAPWLESDREQNIHYEDCTVTLTATPASGALKGFNLIGNPFIRPIPCERPYYSLNPDFTWQAHPDGGTLAIGQAVLVHTETDGEQLTITPSGIAGNGSKSLPPLPSEMLAPVIVLADNADNTSTIATAATACTGGKTLDVQLQGRTLYKDGAWNTLCLPFSMDAEQVTAQLAPAALMTLKSSAFAGGELTLTFEDATTIEAGKPYIIKWDATTPDYIENPEFTGVTVSNATSNVPTSYADFIGTYSLITWESENKSILFLGDNNTLYFPQPDGDKIPHLGAFRGYFQLNGITASDITEARMNFDEQGTQTGIGHTEITERADAWYSLDGRKLVGKPTSKGLYIHGNKKVVVE